MSGGLEDHCCVVVCKYKLNIVFKLCTKYKYLHTSTYYICIFPRFARDHQLAAKLLWFGLGKPPPAPQKLQLWPGPAANDMTNEHDSTGRVIYLVTHKWTLENCIQVSYPVTVISSPVLFAPIGRFLHVLGLHISGHWGSSQAFFYKTHRMTSACLANLARSIRIRPLQNELETAWLSSHHPLWLPKIISGICTFTFAHVFFAHTVEVGMPFKLFNLRTDCPRTCTHLHSAIEIASCL